jgi:hypothetical protein
MNPNVGGLGGYGDPRSQGMIKGLGEGTPLTQLFKGRIPDGSLVEGVVLNEGEGAYLVRVAGQLFQARSTIPLFVGQHFRALYDASGEVPLLRLTQEDLALVASFEGKERTIATALLARGFPLSDDMLWIMRQAWAGTGNDPKALGSLMELWARNLPMTAENATLLSWYLELDPSEAARLWGEIRDRLRSRERNRPEEILGDLRSGSEESTKFLKAHALVSRPSREGVDPSALLASAWWPVEDREEGYPLLARVAGPEGLAGGLRGGGTEPGDRGGGCGDQRPGSDGGPLSPGRSGGPVSAVPPWRTFGIPLGGFPAGAASGGLPPASPSGIGGAQGGHGDLR